MFRDGGAKFVPPWTTGLDHHETNMDGPALLDVPGGGFPSCANGVTLRNFPETPFRFLGTSPEMNAALEEPIPRSMLSHLHSFTCITTKVVGRDVAANRYALHPASPRDARP